jgi:hypothetical protein
VCAAFLELLPADCENGLQKDYLEIALEGVYSWRRRQEKVHRVRVKDIRLSGEGDLRSTKPACKAAADGYCHDGLDETLDISKHGECRDLRLGSLTPTITWNEEYDTNKSPKD